MHDDGTSSNEDRLGAIGDVAFTLERAEIDDDVLVIAGDNLFDYDARRTSSTSGAARACASAVAVHDVGDLRLASQYGIVDVAGDDRVVAFVEKPSEPASTLAATATYIYRRAARPARRAVSRRGERARSDPGASSRGCTRASRSTPTGSPARWLDIGDREQLLAADNMLRRAQGLPERAEYQLEI